MFDSIMRLLTGKAKTYKVELPEGLEQLEVIQANRWWG